MSGLDKLRGVVDDHSRYDIYLTDEEVQALAESSYADSDSTYEGTLVAGVIGQLMRQFTSLNIRTDTVYTYVYKPDDDEHTCDDKQCPSCGVYDDETGEL